MPNAKKKIKIKNKIKKNGRMNMKKRMNILKKRSKNVLERWRIIKYGG